MADNVTDGVIVEVSADTSKLTAPLQSATTQFKQFTSTLSQGMTQSTQAMAGAEAAANTLGNTTKNLGETISATGSRRELNESLSLMRNAATGSANAFDVLSVSLRTFGSALGGAATVGIAAAIAALVALYEYVKNYTEEQKELNEASQVFKLPIDQVKAMSSAMRDLANDIASAQEGFSHLSDAKFDLLKNLGLDPSKAASAQQAFVAIYNSSASIEEKIRQFGILTGAKSADDAQKAWDKFYQESKESANGWFQDMMSMQAVAAMNEAGQFDEAAKMMPKTKGQTWGLNENSSGPLPSSKTDQQISDAKQLQDTLTSLSEKGAQARIAVMQNEADKIIAEAQIEAERLETEKQKQLDAHKDNPSAQAALGAGYDQAISDVQSNARIRAQQVAHQQQLDEQTKFINEMSALTSAASQSDVTANMNASQRIIADGAARVAALKKQLDDYLNSPEFQKLGASDKAQKTAALTSQFNATSSSITSNAQTHADEVAKEEQLQNEKQFQAQLTEIDKQAAQSRIALEQDPVKRAQMEGDLRLQEEQAQYDKELTALEQQLNKKLIDEQTYEQEVQQLKQKYSEAETLLAQETALKVQQANPAQALLLQWQNTTQQMNQFWADTMNSMASGLAQFCVTGKLNFQQFAQSILTELIKIQIEKDLAGIFGGIFGGGAGAFSGTASSWGTGFAGGGTVQAGVPIPVGERGPEMFVPNTAGNIVSNSAMGGGFSGAVHIQMTNNGTPQQVKSATPTMTGSDMVIQIVLDDLRRGGKISQGMQSRYGLRTKAFM